MRKTNHKYGTVLRMTTDDDTFDEDRLNGSRPYDEDQDCYDNDDELLDLIPTRHESVAHLLKQFRTDHLPPHLRVVSQASRDLAVEMCRMLPDNPELTVGLRKLREAKDCFVITRVITTS